MQLLFLDERKERTKRKVTIWSVEEFQKAAKLAKCPKIPTKAEAKSEKKFP